MSDPFDTALSVEYGGYSVNDPLAFTGEAIDWTAFPPLLNDFYHNDTDREGMPKIPIITMLKVKAKKRERAIRLSDMGKTLIPDLFQVPYPLPELPALGVKLRRLSRRIPEGNPINNKYFRKTRESWLVFYYPDKALQIVLSQGHTTTTQYEHYLNIPFEEDDRKEMRKWVEGWS